MEEYWSLNWSRRERRPEAEIQRIFNHDAGTADVKDIWNLHLNEIDPRVLSSASAQPSGQARPFIDPRTKCVVEQTEVNWSKEPKTKDKFPLKLFRAFPERGFRLFRRHHYNGLKALGMTRRTDRQLSEIERMILLEHESMKGKIAKERKVFDLFVKSYVDTKLRERFSHPVPEIVELGKNVISKETSKNLNHFFVLQTAIRLQDPKGEEIGITETNLILEEQELKSIGLVQTLQFRTETPMAGTLPISTKLGEQVLLKDPKLTIRYNEFIASLGRKSGGIFLTTDVIYSLLNPEEVNSWKIPFLIQESDASEQFLYFKSVSQNPASLSDLELERIGQKICYQAAIFSRDFHHTFCFEKMRFLDGSEESVSGNDKDIDTEDDEEESRLMIDDTEETSSQVKDSEEIEIPEDKTKESSKSIPEAAEYKMIEFDEYLSKYSHSDHKEPQNFLVNGATLKPLTGSHPPISIVVTSSCDGLYHKEFVALSFKIEYISEFGAQKMGLDELIKEWCSIAFSSRITELIRVRIDYKTSIVMSVEKLSREDVEMEMKRLYKITPELLLFRLYNLLSIVQQFPPGKYLLAKEMDDPQVWIYMQTDDEKNAKKLDEVVPNSLRPRPAFVNQPIDDQVVTQLHRIDCCMPGCIPTSTKQQSVNNNQRMGPYSLRRPIGSRTPTQGPSKVTKKKNNNKGKKKKNKNKKKAVAPVKK